MGERLHVPVPAHAALPPRPRALRRRCRAPGVAVRRARREQRHPGRRQPRWKLDARAARAGAGRAARHATTRERVRGRRREHPELDARDRLHHAEERRVAHVPRRGAGAGAATTRSRAGSSTAAGCRCRRRTAAAHCRRWIGIRSTARWCPGRRRRTRRCVGGRSAWLLDHVGGRFELLVFAPVSVQWLRRTAALGRRRGADYADRRGARSGDAGEVRVIEDAEGLVQQRYDGQPGTVYLLRPDQHVAARWRTPRLVGSARGRGARSGKGRTLNAVEHRRPTSTARMTFTRR